MTPLRPSASSYRQPRSRSMPFETETAASALILARNPPVGGAGGVGASADQFKVTRAIPPAPPDFVSDTLGAPLVSVTLPPPVRGDAGGADAAGGAGEDAGADGAAAGGGAGLLGRLV